MSELNNQQQHGGTSSMAAAAKAPDEGTDRKPWIARNQDGHVTNGTANVAVPAGYTHLTTRGEINDALETLNAFEVKQALIDIYVG